MGGEGPAASLVVGYDRSLSSRRALLEAIQLGRRLRASLRVVHAVDLADHPVDPDGPEWDSAGLLESESGAVARLMERYEYSWSYEVVYGDPATALAAAADGSDALMIVVGAAFHGSGHGFLSRMLNPSVVTRLVDRAGRPVLAVGPPPAVPVAGAGQAPAGNAPRD